jgi:hypothetical protein
LERSSTNAWLEEVEVVVVLLQDQQVHSSRWKWRCSEEMDHQIVLQVTSYLMQVEVEVERICIKEQVELEDQEEVVVV